MQFVIEILAMLNSATLKEPLLEAVQSLGSFGLDLVERWTLAIVLLFRPGTILEKIDKN